MCNLKIISYNCQGFKNRNFDYINNIYKDSSVLLLQETWLHDFDSSKITTVLPGSCCHALSSMDARVLSRGRDYGGTAVVWRSDLNLKVTPLATASPRLCAVTMESASVMLLVMSVYMPVDERQNQGEYNEVIEDINSLVNEYEDFNVIIGGDFNTDIIRNNERSRIFMQWNEAMDLMCPQLQPGAPRKPTRYAPDGSASLLDYIFVSGRIQSSIEQWDVIDVGENLSDHCPVIIDVKISVDVVEKNLTSEYTPRWCKATNDNIAHYKNNLRNYLSNIDIPQNALLCRNFTDCQTNEHRDSFNTFLNDVIEASQQATQDAIPIAAPGTAEVPSRGGMRRSERRGSGACSGTRCGKTQDGRGTDGWRTSDGPHEQGIIWPLNNV